MFDENLLTIIAPPNRSYMVRSNASRLLMCHRAVITHYQFTLLQNLCHCRVLGSVADKAEWAVRPPSNNVAAVPDEASASAISLCELIVAKINEIKVFPVPPGASK
ncbi:hypothetical protein PR048_021746 [Dryococelus australis]|uniref:Uncharacterized protein n=1 Tax=Dryococelus australis TaxID=614101 RepID=A0ABQ9GZ24_9NEOP|nr:hypothetical protein PR048_021746 [Dryococelus australis]